MPWPFMIRLSCCSPQNTLLYTLYLLRRKRNIVKIIHKTSKIKANLDVIRPRMVLRSKTKVKLKNEFTSITKVYKSPLYRGMRLWDQLPPDLQQEENNIKLKNDINKFIWKENP